MNKIFYRLRIAFQIIFNVLFFSLFIFALPIALGNILIKTEFFTLFSALSTFAYSLFVLILYIVITIIFGRFYCSILCPLGAMQDLFINIKPKRKKMYPPYSTKITNIFRFIAVLIFSVSIFASASWVAGLFDPYSMSARLFTNVVQPLLFRIYDWIVFALNRADIYFLKPVMVNPASLWVTLSSLLLPLAIVVIAVVKSERSYCNSFCPVGAILSILSRFSIFKIVIDENSCINCALCEKSCPAYAIDSKNYKVDQSRCVRCLKCQAICPKKSISFTPETEGTKSDRLSFFDKSITIASGTIAALVIPDRLLRKKNYTESETNFVKRSIPPGAISYKHLSNSCIGCGRCVDICPSKTLRLDITNKPYLNYHEASCEYECNKCGIVCPVGAIQKKSVPEKKLIAIGLVNFISNLCVVVTEGNDCGACAEHCPTGAVVMGPYNDRLYIPVTDTKLCVGCGSCERVCPVRPERAIIVQSLKTHKTAMSPHSDSSEQAPMQIENNDFNF